MRLRVACYAAAMLLTGSINTIATKYQDLSVEGVKPDGTPVFFQHPAFQSAAMFLGEALCLVPYFILRWRRRIIKAQQGIPSKPKPPTSYFVQRTLAFAIPTLCDATATTLLNVGLFYTFASTYQMLRGTLVLFTGFLTILVLRRSLYLHHWLGMILIFAGAAIVGAASLLPPAHPHDAPKHPELSDVGVTSASFLEGLSEPGDVHGGVSGPQPDPITAGGMLHGMLQLHWPGLWSRTGAGDKGVAGHGPAMPMGPLFGDLMVVAAQGFTALQFVLEEKFLSQYRMQPLLAVGIEGAWGVILCLAAVPLLSKVHTAGGQPLDDAGAAFQAMIDNSGLRYAVIGSVFSIGAFNFFGLSVTQALSGASRATIDACRTIIIWAFSLLAGWESFRQLQVVGFLVLLSGTSLYNELLRSCISRRPADYLSSSDTESDGSEGGSEGGSGEEADGEEGLAQGSQDRRRHGSRAGAEVDAEGGLSQPLLAGQGNNERVPRSSIRITGTGGAHQHTQRVFTMARSMRLGLNALSPHDLVDEDESEGEFGTEASMDVVDPMALAATPYFGHMQSGALMGRDGSAPSSPRRSTSDLEEPPQFSSAARGKPSRGPSAGDRGSRQTSRASSQQGARTSAAQGEGAATTGGFMAFLASRQRESTAQGSASQAPPPGKGAPTDDSAA